MTLVQLRHFLALAETASFSKAAQQNFLTQPALSRSIQALERELGWPLFDRIGRRIELSTFGRQMVERAGKLVFEAEELRLSGQRLRDGETGPLRVGMGSGPGAMLMTPLLMEMAREHPQLHVEVSRGSTAMLLTALRARVLDAMAVDTRSLQPAPDLHLEILCEMRGAFMVRKGHPLL
ncbi:MAG: LysR family transcriptional regulator, partial [Betaproteobacteria bacterium]|nr:LysR family transcriptional regulator [Betaproteobacteria bacterium]